MTDDLSGKHRRANVISASIPLHYSRNYTGNRFTDDVLGSIKHRWTFRFANSIRVDHIAREFYTCMTVYARAFVAFNLIYFRSEPTEISVSFALGTLGHSLVQSVIYQQAVAPFTNMV